MSTSVRTPPTSLPQPEPNPDAAYHALLDRLGAAHRQLARRLHEGRRTPPDRRPALLAELQRIIGATAGELHVATGGWPPLPAPDEAP